LLDAPHVLYEASQQMQWSPGLLAMYNTANAETTAEYVHMASSP